MSRPRPSRRGTDNPPPPGLCRATARRDRGAPGGQASSHAILQPGERRKARGKRGGMPAGRTEEEQERLQKAERVPARDRAVWKKRERQRGREQARSEPQLPARRALFIPGRRAGPPADNPRPARSAPLLSPQPLTALRRARRRLPAALQPRRGRGMLGRVLFIAAGSAAPRLWGAAPRSPARCTWTRPRPRPRPESGRAGGGGQAGVGCVGTGKGLRDSWRCGLHGVGAERWSQLPRHLPRCPTAPMAASGSGERPRHGGDADRRVRASLNSENRGTCCIPIKNCSMRRCGRVNYLPPHDAPEGICASYLN